jgi:hypothetical protein
MVQDSLDSYVTENGLWTLKTCIRTGRGPAFAANIALGLATRPPIGLRKSRHMVKDEARQDGGRTRKERGVPKVSLTSWLVRE